MPGNLTLPDSVGRALPSAATESAQQRRPTELVWTEHPLIDRIEGGKYRRLSDEEMRAALTSGTPEEVLLEYWQAREERIRKAEADPLQHGFELPHWERLRHVIAQKKLTGVLGANNSAKSYFAGKLAMECLTRRFEWEGMYPSNLRVLMVAQDEGSSLQYQQPAVYLHAPTAMKAHNTQSQKKRSTVTKFAYSQANGFTESTFVLPNKAQCWFKTVAQYTRDPNSFEGPAYHLVLIDEGCPVTLLDLLRVRAAKIGGKVVYLHTCVHGVDATSLKLLTGARFVETLPMQWDFMMGSGRGVAATGGINPALKFPELKLDEVQVRGCPPGHMPFVMQPLDPNAGLIFTWCHWNPFQPTGTFNGGGLPDLFDTCLGQPKWKVRVKLFGWIEKLAGAKIGNFDPNIHVIAHEKIEKLLAEKKLTTYCMADPHIARSYFIVWKGVDENGIEYIFDECPNLDEGEWVDANGDEGEGTRVYGSVGVNFYKKLMRERERGHGCEPARRFGDPRAFATQAAAADGGTSLFELFMHDGSARGDARPTDDDYAPMYFEPARIRQTVDLDLERFVTLLQFDREKYEREGTLTVENQPKLYISDRCQNVIRALLNFDGDSKSPFKDPIDAGARYGFCEETPHLDPKQPEVVGGGAWR